MSMSTAAMLKAHPHAALEYWFFKVNAEPVALLVDWIARRKTHEHWLRVSIHSPGKRAVLFDRHASPVSQGPNFLTGDRTVGQLGEVAWELDFELGTEWIDPNVFPPTLSRCLKSKNRLSSTECLATSECFRGGLPHGIGTR
jgi:hypothetical protein